MNRLTQYTLKITTPTANWNWLIHKCKKVCRILYFKYYVIVKSLLADCQKQIKKRVEYCSRKHNFSAFLQLWSILTVKNKFPKYKFLKFIIFFDLENF